MLLPLIILLLRSEQPAQSCCTGCSITWKKTEDLLLIGDSQLGDDMYEGIHIIELLVHRREANISHMV